MTEKWKNKFIFKFKYCDKYVSQLLVDFILISSKKNNFSIGAFLTDENGEIEIKKDYLVIMIEKSKKEFPMDYSGNIDDCIGIKFIVNNSFELNNKVEAIMKYYPDEAIKLKEKICLCSNDNIATIENIIYMPIELTLIAIDLSES